jgi:hypothetical protein
MDHIIYHIDTARFCIYESYYYLKKKKQTKFTEKTHMEGHVKCGEIQTAEMADIHLTS